MVFKCHEHSYSWIFKIVMNTHTLDGFQRSLFLTFLSIVKNFDFIDAGFNDDFKTIKNSDSCQLKTSREFVFVVVSIWNMLSIFSYFEMVMWFFVHWIFYRIRAIQRWMWWLCHFRQRQFRPIWSHTTSTLANQGVLKQEFKAWHHEPRCCGDPWPWRLPWKTIAPVCEKRLKRCGGALRCLAAPKYCHMSFSVNTATLCLSMFINTVVPPPTWALTHSSQFLHLFSLFFFFCVLSCILSLLTIPHHLACGWETKVLFYGLGFFRFSLCRLEFHENLNLRFMQSLV